MPGKTFGRLTAFIGILFSSLAAGAQDSSKTVNGRLLGLDGSPQREYTIQSKLLQTKATTSEEGKFSLKIGAADSLFIVFQGTQLGAVKAPEFPNFQIQFAQNNKFNISPLSAEAARDSSRPAAPVADTVANPLPVAPVTDSVVAAPKPDTATVARDSATSAAVRPDTTATKDTVYVTGTVVDIAGKPIAFASIAYPDGTTVSGTEGGSFRIPLKTGATVRFSAVGYKEKDVILVSAAKPLQVQLSTTSGRQLQEVKVTAMGVSKKGRAVGYSIQEVKGDAVQVAKEQNFVNALQGKLAGVQINGNSGSMGGSSKVVIRGAKSITGNNNALFVVDGIFMGNNNPSTSYNQQIGGGGYDYGSPIQDINPDDIEQISVLKGAAASALYGSRGSNGVVLVTTKKGSASSRLGITYSLNAQMDKVYILPNYQNRYGGGNRSNFDTLWYNEHPDYFLNQSAATYSDPVRGRYDLMPQYNVDESWGPELLGQVIRPYYSFDRDKGNPYFGRTTTWSPQPNNLRDFYENGLTLTNSISISGGGDKGTFRLSYSNLSQNFILPNSKLNRNNLTFNGTHKLNDYITAVASANYSYQDATGRPGTGFGGTNVTQYMTMFGQRQLENDMLRFYQFADGSQVTWNRQSFDNPEHQFATTPYWAVNKNYTTDNRNRLFGLAGFEIKPADWLNISAKVFMDQFTTLAEERTPRDYQVGSYTRIDRTFKEFNYLLLANAKKDLSSKFNLNATVGGNLMKQRDEINSATAPGLVVRDVYNLRNSLGRVTYTPLLFRREIQSVFGDVVLGYDNTVFLEFTGRNDWSSTLGPGNNSYFYPSASLSAVFSDWLKWKWLSFGKLRTSVAQIGSDTDPYRIYQAFSVPTLFGEDPMISKDPALANPNLKPERSTEVEAGVELKFLNNRVGLDVAVYNRITKDLIVPLQVSPTSGNTTYFSNIGKSRSRGIEVELSGTPIELNNSFTWNIGLNFAMNRSKLLELNFPNNPGVDRYVVGTERRLNSVSTVAIVGQPLFMLTGTDYTYDANGNKVVGDNGYYQPSASGQVLGTTQPDFVGGLSNSFSYKGVSLSALLDFQKGGNFFSYTNMYGKASGMLYETAADNIRETGIIVDGVKAGGQPNDVRITATEHFKNNFGTKVNRADIYDGSFIYLREVRLGYELPEKLAGVIKARTARLSLYGRNLWLIQSNVDHVDPSNIINSDSNIQGLEGGALPSVRSFGVNLTIGF